MSEETQVQEKRVRVLSISRKAIQFVSFFLVNFAILEMIFNTEFTILDDLLQILPFLQSANSAWTAGAGIMEYIFHSILKGQFPWFFIGLIGLFGLFGGRVFCGWVCPTGFIQDLFAGLSDQNPSRKIPISTDHWLKRFKIYILLFFIVLIAPVGVFMYTDPQEYTSYLAALGGLSENPLWPVSFSEFFFVTIPGIVTSFVETGGLSEFFNADNTWRIVFLFIYLIILIASVFYPRFYCRYVCPYGAAISIFSEYSFIKLKRLPTRCPGRKECGICEEVCPMQIRILDEPFGGFTGRGECTLCLDCLEACPHDAIKWNFGF